MGEYIGSLNEEDSDDAILNWENSLVFGIIVESESEIKPPYQTDSDEFIENLSHTSLPKLRTSKSTCMNMNLGTDKDPKNIRVYSGLNFSCLRNGYNFF